LERKRAIWCVCFREPAKLFSRSRVCAGHIQRLPPWLLPAPKQFCVNRCDNHSQITQIYTEENQAASRERNLEVVYLVALRIIVNRCLLRGIFLFVAPTFRLSR